MLPKLRLKSPPSFRRNVHLQVLDKAYRTALYVVEAGAGRVTIRVGELNARLDHLMRRVGARNWCFITACNPRSRPRPSWQNVAGNRGLRRQLLRHGYSIMDGWSGGEHWGREPSFWVPGISLRVARQWGRRHGQSAVLWGERGSRAQLIWCRAPHTYSTLT